MRSAGIFGGGIKLVGLEGEAGKISALTLRRALEERQWASAPCQSCVLSLSQATEAGTIYRPDVNPRACRPGAPHGVVLHMDGAGWPMRSHV